MEVDQPVEHGMTLSENKDGCSVVLHHFLVCMEATIQEPQSALVPAIGESENM